MNQTIISEIISIATELGITGKQQSHYMAILLRSYGAQIFLKS